MLDETPAPLRVLIAEDETIIRMDLRGLLEKNGFMIVAEAADGAQAVELARSAEPDVAIVDLRMPELDGIEAARRIYAERPLPIVMLTAFSDRANVEDAIGAGIFAYLVKPFRETDVIPAVRAAVARHAELLAARRSAGETPVRAIVMGVRSRSGSDWNLRIAPRDDGSVDVSGA
jgi:response regulator NasT